jgi:hypothetical protein
LKYRRSRSANFDGRTKKGTVALIGLLIVVRVHHRTLRVDSIDQFHPDVRQLEEQHAELITNRHRQLCQIGGSGKRDRGKRASV